ncbi:MAG: DUF188 domain-containing protein [Treponema sp.]|nr:DUF188 domain-containing protein [Treponema sp.]
MNKIHIWIDADSCPLKVRNQVTKQAKKFNIQVTFVANKKIDATWGYPFEMIVCPSVKDAADDYILSNAEGFDLVITKDIVFASKLIDKNICVINDRGTALTKDNIKEFLSERDFNLQLSNIGLLKHNNEGYDQKKFQKFCDCFDRTITKLMDKYII